MKNLIKNTVLTIVVATMACTTACKKKVEETTNQEELITTVLLNFSNTDTTFVVKYEDLDGAGGNAPTIGAINLKANKTYNVSLVITDASKTPTVNISDEVKAEGTDHQFFYVVNTANVSVKTTDVDANNNPLGLMSAWATTTANTGSVTLTLKHQPNIKPAVPGNITVGDTDIEATFAVTIK
jgi:hypothetical protein